MNVIIQLAQPHSRALSSTLYSKSIQNRVAKCYGYDGYGRTHNLAKSSLFWGRFENVCKISVYKLAKIGRVVNSCSMKVSFMLVLFRFSAKTVAIYAFSSGKIWLDSFAPCRSIDISQLWYRSLWTNQSSPQKSRTLDHIHVSQVVQWPWNYLPKK